MQRVHSNKILTMQLPKKTIFIVVYGYKPTDFVLVDNTIDLQKAIYARVEKIPVTIGGKLISGQEIKTIEPDVHSYTGWNRGYVATHADDFTQIKRDVPPLLSELLEQATQHVNKLVSSGRQELIGSSELPALNEKQ